MGEYEPDDSRNITQKKGNVPGEPPRTGPREDEARRKAEPLPGKKQPSQQQQAQSQSQGSGGMSQSMGGMSQSFGTPAGQSAGQPAEQPPAPGASRVQAETFEEKAVETVDADQPVAPPPHQPDRDRQSETGIGATGSPTFDTALDSYAAELAVEQSPSNDDERRRQASEQGDAKGYGYDADEERPEATGDLGERGYGDSGEERLAVLKNNPPQTEDK